HGARLGRRERLPRSRHVDAARQRGDAGSQRAPGLRVPRRHDHDGRAAAADGPRVRRADPTRLYYILQFLLFMPTWVVVAVYLVRVAHLSPLQLILMGTAMEAAVFLFEVPTGVVADTY